MSETATDLAEEALAAVPDDGAIVLFDGVCNFCSWSVQFVHEHDDGTVRFAPLQSAVGRALLERHGLEADYIDSLVYLGDDGLHTKSDGAVRIARHLEGPWRHLWLARFVPTPVRDVAYDVFGSLRYRLFGKKESCMIPGPDLRARFLDDPTDEFGNVDDTQTA